MVVRGVGLVQESKGKMAQKGTQPGDPKERVRSPVQQLHAAVRQRTLRRIQLLLQQLGLEDPHPARLQELSVGLQRRQPPSVGHGPVSTDVLLRRYCQQHRRRRRPRHASGHRR